ncbi:hypothetical protein BC830DRAFT_1175764 [Chytriomyces sp. MP71]|nr:hypothetical protein BC830DRAFT_1175764 [Chytriomyces sp. MP71]
MIPFLLASFLLLVNAQNTTMIATATVTAIAPISSANPSTAFLTAVPSGALPPACTSALNGMLSALGACGEHITLEGGVALTAAPMDVLKCFCTKTNLANTATLVSACNTVKDAAAFTQNQAALQQQCAPYVSAATAVGLGGCAAWVAVGVALVALV